MIVLKTLNTFYVFSSDTIWRLAFGSQRSVVVTSRDEWKQHGGCWCGSASASLQMIRYQHRRVRCGLTGLSADALIKKQNVTVISQQEPFSVEQFWTIPCFVFYYFDEGLTVKKTSPESKIKIYENIIKIKALDERFKTLLPST